MDGSNIHFSRQSVPHAVHDNGPEMRKCVDRSAASVPMSHTLWGCTQRRCRHASRATTSASPPRTGHLRSSSNRSKRGRRASSVVHRLPPSGTSGKKNSTYSLRAQFERCHVGGAAARQRDQRVKVHGKVVIEAHHEPALGGAAAHRRHGAAHSSAPGKTGRRLRGGRAQRRVAPATEDRARRRRRRAW